MKKLLSLAALGMAASLSAQSPLVGNPPMFVVNTANPVATFADMSVTTQITLQSLQLDYNTAAGTTGTIDVYMTDGTTTTTHVGNEFIPAAWTLMTSASVTVVQPGLTNVCLDPPVVMNPGDYGFCIVHSGGTVPVFADLNAPAVSTAELTMSAGAVSAWIAGPFVNGTFFAGYPPTGEFSYFPGDTTGVIDCSTPATHEAYGDGCFRERASIWEFLTSAEANANNGSIISFLPDVSTYRAIDGTGITTYQAPTAGATVLNNFMDTTPAVNDDDGEIIYNLGTDTFTGGDGAAVSDLYIHSNGIVSTTGVEAALIAAIGNSFQQAPFVLVDIVGEVFGINHDFNITAANNVGNITAEVVAGFLHVTWDNVQSYPEVDDNPGTVQLQLQLNTGSTPGIVNLIVENISAIAATGYMPIYSPAGDNEDHPEIDIFNLDPAGLVLPLADLLPLTMTAAGRPLIGTTSTFTTANWTAPPGLDIGLHYVSTVQIAPGTFDLFFAALTPGLGCDLLIDSAAGEGFVITGATPDFAFPLPIDPNIVGLQYFNQSFELGGLILGGPLVTTASNGITSTIGSF